MRCLFRNKRTFYYAQYLGKEMILDAEGNATGEYEVKYSDPEKYRGNISWGGSKISVDWYGTKAPYDQTIILDHCPLTENSILWIDRTPDEGPYDYIVTRVAEALTSVAVGIKRVKTSE